MALRNILQRDSALFTLADSIQDALGQIDILQIVPVLEDGFQSIARLDAPCALGQLFKAVFDDGRKPDASVRNLAATRVEHS